MAETSLEVPDTLCFSFRWRSPMRNGELGCWGGAQELGCSLFQRGFSGITEKEMQKTAVVVSFLQETAGKKDLRRGAPCPRPLQARHAQA